MQQRLRILLIDDHVLFRESLSRLFASEPDLEVVGQCERTSQALAILQNTPVDVMLLDFNLGTERGTDLIAAVRRAGYTGKILMVTAAMDAGDSQSALQLGAAGIFLKHNSPADLSRAIRLVVAGGVWLDRRLVELMAESVPLSTPGTFGSALTDREEQVLHGIMEGSTNRAISEQLGASQGAVKAAIQQLFRKTGVRTRSQLVRVALEGRIAHHQK